MMNQDTHANLGIVADIVSAYVSNNSIASNDLAGLIANVHQALLQAAQGPRESAAEPLKPPVPIKKSITPDYLICLEDERGSSPSSAICEPATICLPSNIVRNGASLPIIRWWPPTMRRSGPALLGRWVSARGAGKLRRWSRSSRLNRLASHDAGKGLLQPSHCPGWRQRSRLRQRSPVTEQCEWAKGQCGKGP